jgi:hypothetical protein
VRVEDVVWFAVAALPLVAWWLALRYNPPFLASLWWISWFGVPLTFAYVAGGIILAGLIRSPRAGAGFAIGAIVGFLSGYVLAP